MVNCCFVLNLQKNEGMQKYFSSFSCFQSTPYSRLRERGARRGEAAAQRDGEPRADHAAPGRRRPVAEAERLVLRGEDAPAPDPAGR